MVMELITTTHCQNISGVISCFDRIILSGNLPQVCYSQGMTSCLYQNLGATMLSTTG